MIWSSTSYSMPFSREIGLTWYSTLTELTVKRRSGMNWVKNYIFICHHFAIVNSGHLTENKCNVRYCTTNIYWRIGHSCCICQSMITETLLQWPILSMMQNGDGIIKNWIMFDEKHIIQHCMISNWHVQNCTSKSIKCRRHGCLTD
jgi:hypothetical protein